jgi:hypothetical protein
MISSLYKDCVLKLDFKGHKGRPGKVGGSVPRSGGAVHEGVAPKAFNQILKKGFLRDSTNPQIYLRNVFGKDVKAIPIAELHSTTPDRLNSTFLAISDPSFSRKFVDAMGSILSRTKSLLGYKLVRDAVDEDWNMLALLRNSQGKRKLLKIDPVSFDWKDVTPARPDPSPLSLRYKAIVRKNRRPKL